MIMTLQQFAHLDLKEWFCSLSVSLLFYFSFVFGLLGEKGGGGCRRFLRDEHAFDVSVRILLISFISVIYFP